MDVEMKRRRIAPSDHERVVMFVTVTIQTYNQADSLRQTLQSLRALRCPDDFDYEILVVDNNSSDGTADVISECGSVLGMRLRRVFEPRQGLSHARNRAIAEARGEIICFIDDDVLVDPDWLAGHLKAYLADSRTVAVGGRVLLRWPDGWVRPAWLTPDLEGFLGSVDAKVEGPIMRFPRYPYGCNMSVRRSVAQQLGGFCPRLGRKKASLISNEEKLFFHRIHVRNGQVAYAPEALVHHVVSPSRLSKRFFLKRAYAQGVSDVIFFNATKPGGRTFMWHVRQVVIGTCFAGCALVSAAFRCIPGVRAQSLSSLVRASHLLGYVIQAAKGGTGGYQMPDQPESPGKGFADDTLGQTG